MAHYDVVPAEKTQLGEWTHPPYSGKVADGKIWGRGALDDKSSVIAIFEAVEYLLKHNYQPEQTIYIAIGADEEVGGLQGNAKIAELLHKKGVTIKAVFDEGLPITQGVIPGINTPVASIGVSEKGYATFKLTSFGQGGHSSLAGIHNPITKLSKLLLDIENNPQSLHWSPILSEFFEELIPKTSWPYKILFSNLWLTRPVVKWNLQKKASTTALIQSTVSATQFHAGVKDNVIPTHAEAVINVRILPNDSVAMIEKWLKHLAAPAGVTVKKIGSTLSEPMQASPRNSSSYRVLAKTIKEIFNGIAVAPNIMVGITDSRHYKEFTPNIYRFFPWTATSETLKSIHGINEHIGVDDFFKAISFYKALIENTGDF